MTAEEVNPEEVVKQVLEKFKAGVSNDDLILLTPNLDQTSRGNAINNLLALGKIEMLSQGGGGGFTLRLCTGTKITGATPEEQLVYSLIEEAGNMGIWIRDIRDKSGLAQTQMRRVLKMLEQKKIVKSVKAVGTTKKCYMLSDLEADSSLTGGTFFSDQQLDTQFIQTLVQVCVQMLLTKRKSAEANNPTDFFTARENSFVKVSEVNNYIKRAGVSRIPLVESDVESILEVAVLDGKAEKRPGFLGQEASYRATRVVNSRTMTNLMNTVPCMHCPLINECNIGHVISPENCEHMNSWC
ncbi:DNA-directed RNA polymerase III subunit RPC6 [Strongyloides ratti]|uniref:DNA-directed RNA polymerase III subunit RPC6 n=1 Tax=Strongyloides ratti TaxID=34506 RepID=A0A090LC20_STRRB|nr:DNA-directed RNA polymerase III subunit RPC6 [Strongyloides ratti]CEF65663.1 DNA-directed RNA polymerase III subunit RPC6 [Strongyloides ratti]